MSHLCAAPAVALLPNPCFAIVSVFKSIRTNNVRAMWMFHHASRVALAAPTIAQALKAFATCFFVCKTTHHMFPIDFGVDPITLFLVIINTIHPYLPDVAYF